MKLIAMVIRLLSFAAWLRWVVGFGRTGQSCSFSILVK